MNEQHPETTIRKFVKSFVESKDGDLAQKSKEVFTIRYPNQTTPVEYTYEPSVAKEKKSLLISSGSPAFQQMLKESLEGGFVCQVMVNPKETFETILKEHFKDSPFACQECTKVRMKDEVISICQKSKPCYHQINKGKIVSIKVTKKEPIRYFQFYFTAKFQSKLRPRDEEIITILLDEKCNVVNIEDINENILLDDESIQIQDFKHKSKLTVFDELRRIAYERLHCILREKLVFFDLPLNKEKKSKIRSFEKRLRRSRHEQAISRKNDFDAQRWQDNYEALLKREEESLSTNIIVKFSNLLVINTTKVSYEVNLGNNATINAKFTLGINYSPEVTCPICRHTFTEGYATQDSLYVCKNCIRQSIDTGKIYSTKANLKLDEALNEYIEKDSGFVCSVCGKRYSKLLKFTCSHDNSNVCIYHYGLCDFCGKVFSNSNLVSTSEFKQKLCPNHAARCDNCHSVVAFDEVTLSTTGKRLCNHCKNTH